MTSCNDVDAGEAGIVPVWFVTEAIVGGAVVAWVLDIDVDGGAGGVGPRADGGGDADDDVVDKEAGVGEEANELDNVG